MQKQIARLLLLSIFKFLICSWGALPTTEQRLLSHLMTKHNKRIRPVINSTQPVKVTFGIEINQLLKVHDREQLLDTKAWVRQSWTNQLLTWNSTEWNGISMVMVQPSDIWIPDVLLYNSGGSGLPGGTDLYKTPIAMYSTGLHWWLAPAIFTSTCKINIKYFPFDHQYCQLKFGSWMHDASEIEMQKDDREIITSKYIPSTEWDIVKVQKQVYVLHYACCPHPYADITFTIHLHRKPSFYVFNVIVPCLVLALTILFGFFFPPESGERIGLIITILLAMAVFMQIISGTLPVNDDTPKLSLFYMVILIESALSLATTCVVLVLHYRSEGNQPYPIPLWVRRVFVDVLAKKMGYLDSNQVDKDRDISQKYGNENKSYSGKYDTEPNRNQRTKSAEDLQEQKKQLQKSQKLSTLREIRRDIHHFVSELKESQETEETNKDWKVVGKVLDRIFFVVFLLTFVISTVAILLPAYFHEEVAHNGGHEEHEGH